MDVIISKIKSAVRSNAILVKLNIKITVLTSSPNSAYTVRIVTKNPNMLLSKNLNIFGCLSSPDSFPASKISTSFTYSYFYEKSNFIFWL